MTTTQANAVLRHIRALASVEQVGQLDDAALLEQFRSRRDGAAFTALLKRHGPMVFGVCRRVLHQAEDAEDAFQATFLALAESGMKVRWQASIGSWLYRVAYHQALKAQAREEARSKHERQVGEKPSTDPLTELTARELLAALDEEPQRLSEKHRAPMVLCYLEGKTRDEAAKQLGWTLRTLKRRLEQARACLRQRLKRRGVALSAALLTLGVASEAVPPALATATAREAIHVASVQTAAVTASVKTLMAAVKLKTVAAALLVAGLVAAGTGAFFLSAPTREPAPQSKADPPRRNETQPAGTTKMSTDFSGRVLDADGKPVAEAQVAVVAEPNSVSRGGELSAGGPHVLGGTKADAEGRFRLNVTRTSSTKFRRVFGLASSAGHGLGWLELNPDAERPEVEIRLPREQIIRGRFVDLQGQPAVSVSVRVASIGKKGPGEFKGVNFFGGPAKDLPAWPKPATTDDKGNFVIHGVGQGSAGLLAVGDDRFATNGFFFETDAKEGAKEFRGSLEPAHIIEGTVTYSDTEKPIPNARVTVYANHEEWGGGTGLDGRADAKGRFRINPYPGSYFQVSAYAPDGEPYLTLRKIIQWPKAAIKQQIELKLPRGVLVRGKITEAGSAAPVAKASVQFEPRTANNPNLRKYVLSGWENTVMSGEDGRFDICVLPGPGHLLVHGPTAHYILTEMGDRQIDRGLPGGTRHYAHAFLAVDSKPDADPIDIAVTLKRGVTVKGHIVGPDDKPVAEAMMLCRLQISPLSTTWRGFPTQVRDGRFELHGLDPAKSYPVYFLDAKNKLGATVELAGKQTGKDMTVRLAPCGSAMARFVDAAGKPIAKQHQWLEIVATPGVDGRDAKSQRQGKLAADAAFVANIDRLNHWDGPLTDAEGRLTFPALIPGATYRIVDVTDRDDPIKKEFTVEAGKTVNLADIVLKKQPQ